MWGWLDAYVYRGVTKGKKFKATASETSQKKSSILWRINVFGFYASASLVFLASWRKSVFLFYASESTNFVAIERTKVLFALC